VAALHPRPDQVQSAFLAFHCWDIPAGRSAIAEVYPALWSRSFAMEGRTPDQHDAYSIAAWLSHADRDGTLTGFLKPELTSPERAVAQVEGWILGVPGPIRAGTRRTGPSSSSFENNSIRKERTQTMKTTEPGHKSKNEQVVVRNTDKPGNDHNQIAHVLRCIRCQNEYGANRSDIWQRRCPTCHGGAKGLSF